MRRIIVGIIVLAAAAGAAWWFLIRGTSVEVSWGSDWPATVRGVGTAVEPVVAPPSHKPTAGDRARAEERARWKAYYYAQLRVAEQLGGLKLDAHTTVHDAVLADRELRARFSDTIRAAAEVDSESKVEDLGDAVRATVVVAVPTDRIVSLREALVHALASGRITLHGPRPAPTRHPKPQAPQIAAAKAGEGGPEHSSAVGGHEPGSRPARSETPQVAARSAGEHARRRSPAPAGREPASGHHAPRRRPEQREVRYTGFVLHLPESSDSLIAAPDFYDAAGAFLGSALDLPDSARAEGIPVAGPRDRARIAEVAGSRPLDLRATVTAGNIMLQRKLNEDEAQQFAQAIRHNRVILVLGEEEG